MLWMDSNFTLFNWHYVSIRSVTETLSKQTDCNSWFRNSECNWKVLCGEVYIPVPLSWILNIKWNGCSIPLENKTFFFFHWWFCFSHWSFLQRTCLLFPWSVRLKMFFIQVKLSQVVSIAQLTECFLTVVTKRESTWTLQQGYILRCRIITN